ncbi:MULTISPECIES: DEAD/DEAH box helicase [Trichococcus]|uniref:DEAD-box ATP-dependent RNA helicase CshA n=2 Tax=Trichococcus TaxID=82802 RepID=A0A2T5IF61_9LACT|nr:MULTISPECIES: DEAD/DEAH box helicase [Trichococcus]PTQ82445.1 ATP-dependent RNA helicase DeaD [Trichococcus patagoniensis]CZR05185.1 dead/deah box helicase [Trichococcus collinsii]SEA76178.1 ATP-dependent RNA helicase DeaD [Trichococcus collinsii]
MKFSELGLDAVLLQSIETMGFEEATPIQTETIPLALKGLDVIGQAQTGTGKTAAFGLPMLQKINTENKAIQGIVIAPTRELAIQTQEELYRLGKDKHVSVQVVYGGADISRQIRALKNKPQIIVGTPGRLLDHIKRKTIRLDHIETLVLDEADEMLNMGFLEDIESILSETPSERQTLLFSATMPDQIKKIGVKFMHAPEHVKIKASHASANLIDQYFVKCKDFEKFDTMTRLFDVQNPELAIVFGRTKRRVDELSKGLELRGYRAEGIHGDLTQQKRMSVLNAFKTGDLDFLVATDVAARGLDVTGVTHVYNYDIPQDPESYVHRIGRTGRAGKEGMSVTFVTPNEMDYLRTIENLTKKPITPLQPPSDEEAFRGQVKSAMDEVESLVKETETDKYQRAAVRLLEEHTAEDLVAAFLKSLSKDATDVPVKITPERPLPSRKGKGGGGYKGKSTGGGYKGNRSSSERRGSGGGERSGERSGNKNRSSDSKPRSGGKRYDDKRGGGSAGAPKKSSHSFTIRSNND